MLPDHGSMINPAAHPDADCQIKSRHLQPKSKMHPSKASYFPKVKFGIIALLILRHIVELTKVGGDSINGWEADEQCGDRLQSKAFSYVWMSTATQLQGIARGVRLKLSE